MSTKRLSGAQRRKRKVYESREAIKSSQILKGFLKRTKSATEEEPDCRMENKSVHDLDQTARDTSIIHPDQDCSMSDNRLNSIMQSNDSSDENISSFSLQSATENQHDDEERSKTSRPDVLMFSDIGYLNFDKKSQLPIISQQLRTELISKGSSVFQNKNAQFARKGGRSMTIQWFTRKLANGLGNEVNRSWLVYSPKKEAAYCFSCLLFSTSTENSRSSFGWESGFSKWSKPEKLRAHENNPCHRKCFNAWKETERRFSQGTTIDAALEAEIQSEAARWRAVLKRILNCLKFLITQNLALRGHREELNDLGNKNVGNFLSLLHLVSHYDAVLKSHLDHTLQNPGSVSYLSPEIQNDFIGILASNLRNRLLSDIRKSKYYGILFDSTPDLAHRDQLSEIIRYVHINFDEGSVTIKESFLGFIEIHGKDAITIEDAIIGRLESDKIALEDCRSQCFDNAAVMSGHLTGVQQRICSRNGKALFVNCDNHSLNLCGVHAASQDPVVITFFGTIERIYLFFSRSTLRWEKLKEAMPITVKRLSETRWSARAECVKAINDGLDTLVSLLENMSNDANETQETRSDALLLLQSILTFHFLVFLPFWYEILKKIDRVQKRLQDPKMNFYEASLDIKSLQAYFSTVRDDICHESVEKAKKICVLWGIPIESRIKRRRILPGELSQDAELTKHDEIVRVMKSVLDRLQQEITTRFTRLIDLDKKFGFLLNVDWLLQTDDVEDLRQHCLDFGNFYNSDVDGTELLNEIRDCKMLLDTRQDSLPANPKELLTFIISYGEDVFPNLRIALQILLTVGVSIASCERSFSKLKIILSYLRTSMNQDRLSDLALMSVERESLEQIDFDEIINQFAMEKARKINLK